MPSTSIAKNSRNNEPSIDSSSAGQQSSRLRYIASRAALEQAREDLHAAFKLPSISERGSAFHRLIDLHVPQLLADDFASFFADLKSVIEYRKSNDPRYIYPPLVQVLPADLAFGIGLMAKESGRLTLQDRHHKAIAESLDSILRAFKGDGFNTLWPSGQRMDSKRRTHYEEQFERFTRSGLNEKKGKLCMFGGGYKTPSLEYFKEAVLEWTCQTPYFRTPYDPDPSWASGRRLFRFGRTALDGLIPFLQSAAEYGDADFIQATEFMLSRAVTSHPWTDGRRHGIALSSNLKSIEALILLEMVKTQVASRSLNEEGKALLSAKIPPIAAFFQWDDERFLTPALKSRLEEIRNVLPRPPILLKRKEQSEGIPLQEFEGQTSSCSPLN